MAAVNVVIKSSGGAAASKDIEGIGHAAEKSSGPLGKLGGALGDVGKIAAGFVVGQGLMKLPGMFSSMIGGASDLNESMSKMRTVFGEQAPDIEKWANGAATAMGQSKSQALEAVGTFGNFLQAMGQTPGVAADMSKSMVELAGDLGSFNNADPTEVLLALRAGLSGEAEPMKKFGVALSEAAVSAKAVELGLSKTGKGMTEQQKIAARYAIIMEQTATAQGDFARTSDGHANQMKILQARFADVRAEIGTALLPVVVSLGSKFADLMNKVAPLVPVFLEMAKAGIAEVWERIQPVIEAVGAALVELGPKALEAGKAIGEFWATEVQPRIEAFVAWLGPKLREAGAFFMTEIVPRIQEFVGWAVPKLQEFADAAGEQFRKFQGYYQTDIKPALDNIRKGIEEVVSFIRQHWPEIEKIVRPVLDQVVNVISTAFGIIKEVIAIVIDLIGGDFSGAWNNFKDLIGIVWEFIKETISNGIEFAKAVMAAGWEAIKAAASAGWDALKDLVRSGINGIGDLAGLAFTKLQNVGSEMLSGVKSGLGNLVTYGISIMQDIWTGIANKALAMVGDLLSIGADIVGGIAQGIYNTGKAAVEAAIGWLMGLIPGWAKSLMGISSPSKVMAKEVGEPIAAGVAAGIIDGIPKVQGAIQRVLGELASGASQAAAIVNGMVFGPGLVGTAPGGDPNTWDTSSPEWQNLMKRMLGGGHVPSFAVGTNLVEQTGMALVHAGEEIRPARARGGGYSGGDGVTVNVYVQGSIIDRRGLQNAVEEVLPALSSAVAAAAQKGLRRRLA